MWRSKAVGVLLCVSLVAVLALTGCGMCKSCEEPVVQAPPPAPAPAAAPAPAMKKAVGPCPSVTREGGMVTATYIMPTGDPDTGEVLLEKSAPEKVQLDTPYTYKVRVKNLTPCPLDDVTLVDMMPSGVQFVSASPKETSAAGGVITWKLGVLGKEEEKSVEITAIAKKEGDLENCAKVTYQRRVCLTVVAINPKLNLTQTAPESVVKCDVIPIKLTVCNPGTGTAKNVKIAGSLPAGMQTKDGSSAIDIAVGDLAAGECKDYSVEAMASKTGSFKVCSTATADGDLTAKACTTTIVRQPVLTIAKKSNKTKLFAGQTFTYTITVGNKGDAPAENTVVTDEVPAGTSVSSVGNGGTESGGTVTWMLGTIPAGGTKDVTLTLIGNEIRTVTNVARAQADCAEAVTASETTPVLGIPAILLEVVDETDPVPVGDTTTYVIIATNQGSSVGTNIAMVVKLEENAELVSATGATEATVRGRIITFAPLPALAAKDKATWKTVVRAVKAGDVRYSVSMTSDQIDRPVSETEATNFYE